MGLSCFDVGTRRRAIQNFFNTVTTRHQLTSTDTDYTILTVYTYESHSISDQISSLERRTLFIGQRGISTPPHLCFKSYNSRLQKGAKNVHLPIFHCTFLFMFSAKCGDLLFRSVTRSLYVSLVRLQAFSSPSCFMPCENRVKNSFINSKNHNYNVTHMSAETAEVRKLRVSPGSLKRGSVKPSKPLNQV